MIYCKIVEDICCVYREGKVVWVVVMEGVMMIENELDWIDLLYGFGLWFIGIIYSEFNVLGFGLKEDWDGGLIKFGRWVVDRMNKVGLLIDCLYIGD